MDEVPLQSGEFLGSVFELELEHEHELEQCVTEWFLIMKGIYIILKLLNKAQQENWSKFWNESKDWEF